MTLKIKTTLTIFVVIGFCLSARASDLLDISKFRALTADKVAYRVGDTVTILILEQSRAVSSAETNSDKEVRINASAYDNTRENDLGVAIASGTGGEAITERNGFLSGQITVTVKEKNSLGHLIVEGTQVILINGEEQSIKIKGALRQEDIAKNNTVISNRLTDAKLEFTGKGDISEAQKKGIIARFFSWLGLI